MSANRGVVAVTLVFLVCASAIAPVSISAETVSGGTTSLSAAGPAPSIAVPDATINDSSTSSSINVAYNASGVVSSSNLELRVSGPNNFFAQTTADPKTVFNFNATVTSSKDILNLTIPAGTFGGGNFSLQAELIDTSTGTTVATDQFNVSVESPVTVSSVAIARSTAYQDQNVTVTTTLDNSAGSSTEPYTVAVYRNGTLQNSKQVTVGAGSTKDVDVNVTFRASTPPGTYGIQVNDEPTQTVQLKQNPIQVQSYTVNSTSLVIGDTAKVTATVSNVGQTTTFRRVSLIQNFGEVAVQNVSVAPGNSKQVTFTTTFNVGGAHAVTVESRPDTKVVVNDPDVSVTGFSLSTTSLYTGDPLGVTATVQNSANSQRPFVVSLWTDSGLAAVKQPTPTISANSQENVQLTTSFFTAGTKNVTVNDLSNKSVTVTKAVKFVNLTTSKDTLTSGESVKINLTYKNPTSKDRSVFAFAWAGQSFSKQVTVPANSLKTVSFTTSFSAPGRHPIFAERNRTNVFVLNDTTGQPDVSITQFFEPSAVITNKTTFFFGEVTNTGNASGVENVTLSVEGQTVASNKVYVDPNQTSFFFFQRNFTSKGTFNGTIATSNSSRNFTFTARGNVIKAGSVSIDHVGGTSPSKLPNANAQFQGGFISVQITNPDAAGFGLAKRNLTSLGVDNTTTFEVNLTVTDYTPRVLVSSGRGLTWTRTNGTTANETNVTITVRPAQIDFKTNFTAGAPSSPTQWESSVRNDTANLQVENAILMGIGVPPNADEAAQTAVTGMTISTDAQLFTMPNYVPGGPSTAPQLKLPIAAPHETVDGNVNQGYYRAFLPDSLLDHWNVTDPESQLSGSYTGSDANLNVSETSGGARVNLTLTYSSGTAVVTAASPTSISDGSSADRNAKADVNVSISDQDGVNESTISVNVTNLQTNETTVLVENGTVREGSLLPAANFTDGQNNQTEFVNVSVALQEGDYTIGVSATDNASSPSTQESVFGSQGSPAFTVNMSGKSFEVVPDDPAFANTRDPGTVSAEETAQVEVYVLDQFGNRLVFNESDSNVTADTSILSANDGSVNITDLDSGVGNHTNPFVFNVSDTEVETVKLTAFDTGEDYTVTSASGQQEFVARVGGLEVSVNETELRADGEARVEATVQLTDGSGGDVAKSGIDISLSLENRTQAGISLVSGSTSQTTDANGTATIVMTASNANVDVTVSAVETSTGNGYNGNASFSTVPGSINATNSDITASPTTAQVNETVTVNVTLQDAQSNVIPGETVTFSTNDSASLSATSVTTDDDGLASVEVQLPTSVGTTRVNASAGGFNASTGASVNITADPGDATALRINASSTVIPVDASRDVPVEVVDAFGNVNATAGPYDVTVTSSDDAVITVGGSNETTLSSVSGSQNVTVAANATTGTASLTANASGLNADTVEFQVGTPDAINLTVDDDRIAVHGAQDDVRKQTTLRAQLTSGGSDIGIANETIEFAVSSGDAADLENFSATTNADGVATVTINATTNTGVTQFIAAAENYTATGDATVTTTGKTSRIRISPEAPDTSSATVGDNVTLGVAFVDSEGRNVPVTENARVSLDTDLGSFVSTGTDAVRVSIAYPSETQGTANLTSDATGEATITGIGRGVTGQTTVTFGEVTQPTAAVTIDDQSYTNRTASVVVANATYTGGDFAVAIHNSSTGSPGPIIGWANLSNGVNTDVTVTLDEDISRNVTVTAMLHESFQGSAITRDGSAVTDMADVTITAEPTGPPALPDFENAPTDPDGDGEYEDINGDGQFNVIDVQALFANLDSDVVQNNVDAFDFNDDGTVNIVDVQALFVET